ncbi:hypothetical protein SISSUDRAFT_1038463 [Sistotremastrum suecicum HHB10207 ss-3]|uniref:Uncharacterized protein n=1 Tax=Sistotremastrum suecicum HHB10207 ss-3 TaxID=1314776 RepID=A0A165WPT9_9AGAM|nr:hypothetical protein SISSUDRAFT_1038463 [Sistotremastrum suecicum HHB10207 ss-3]
MQLRDRQTGGESYPWLMHTVGRGDSQRQAHLAVLPVHAEQTRTARNFTNAVEYYQQAQSSLGYRCTYSTVVGRMGLTNARHVADGIYQMKSFTPDDEGLGTFVLKHITTKPLLASVGFPTKTEIQHNLAQSYLNRSYATAYDWTRACRRSIKLPHMQTNKGKREEMLTAAVDELNATVKPFGDAFIVTPQIEKTLPTNSPIYPQLPGLRQMNLLCGEDDPNVHFDIKHVLEREQNCLLPGKGIRLPSARFKYKHLLKVYANFKLIVRERLIRLSAAAHIFFAGYSMYRGNLCSGQLNFDETSIVETAYFTAAKVKADNPDGKLHLMLLGIDASKILLGLYVGQ